MKPICFCWMTDTRSNQNPKLNQSRALGLFFQLSRSELKLFLLSKNFPKFGKSESKPIEYDFQAFMSFWLIFGNFPVISNCSRTNLNYVSQQKFHIFDNDEFLNLFLWYFKSLNWDQK